MKTVKLIIDGKEIEAQVNEEDLKVIEKKKDRADKGSNYYYFNSNLLFIENTVEEGIFFDECCYDNGNYFLTKKECADAARVVSLWLRMKRFADEHNEGSIDFDNRGKTKISICFDDKMGQITMGYYVCVKNAFQIYFDSEETAKKAIDEFHDDLIWYFTEYGKDN